MKDRPILEAANLGPGDRVLLTMAEPMREDDLTDMRHELVAQFPDVHFVFVVGVSGLAVDKADD